MKTSPRFFLNISLCLWLALSLAGCFRDHAPAGPASSVPAARQPATVDNSALTDEQLNQPLPESPDLLGQDSDSVFYLANESEGRDEFRFSDFGSGSGESGVDISTPTVAAPVVTAPPRPVPSTVTAPVTSSPNDYTTRLSQAKERKEKAFVRYTRLATEGGAGDIEEALREYREAYAELKQLEAQGR